MIFKIIENRKIKLIKNIRIKLIKEILNDLEKKVEKHYREIEYEESEYKELFHLSNSIDDLIFDIEFGRDIKEADMLRTLNDCKHYIENFQLLQQSECITW